MGENGGTRKVRVILRWIQIKDSLEPFYDETGEFFFTTRVSTGGQVVENRLPEEGQWEISDHPSRNKVDKIDLVLFEGELGETMTVELLGEEVDPVGANDHLETYAKDFTGPAETWIGRQAPGDEGSDDPENLSNWRICYDVELA